MSKHVFISYAEADSDAAFRICDSLEQSGIKCWVAPRDVPLGVNYPRKIIQAIKESSVFVLVFSSNSITSDHVISESLAAFNSHKPIIAFRIENIEPSEDFEYLLGSKTWFNAFIGKIDDHFNKLVREIKVIGEHDRAESIDSNILTVRSSDTSAVLALGSMKNYRSWMLYLTGILIAIISVLYVSGKVKDIQEAGAWIPLLVGLIPIAIIAPDGINEIIKNLRRKKLKHEGETGTLKDPEYFRIYPYESIPDYMKEFRADKAHERVLEWIIKSHKPILFLSGQSGTGKTSILNAYVCPQIEKHDPAYKTISIRAFGDPLTDLQKELIKLGLIDVCLSSADMDLHPLLDKAVSAVKTHKLLVVFDQFEELMVIQERDPLRIEAVKQFLNSLVNNPIKGLTILLSFRTDYLPQLEIFNLPPLISMDNWFEVSAFSEANARRFLRGSNIKFPKKTLDKLFEQIAAFEGTKGLVRPIILNMVGLIVSKSQEMISEIHDKRTENLLVEYLKYNIFQREMKDHAPQILDNMVTEVGSKKPKSIKELTAETGFGKAEIKGVLNLLANAGLVRLIDKVEDIWEVAHDFVAHHLLIVLRGRRRNAWGVISPYLAPAVLVLWGLSLFLFIPAMLSDYQIQQADKYLRNLTEKSNQAQGGIGKYGNRIDAFLDGLDDPPNEKTLQVLASIKEIYRLDLKRCKLESKHLQFLHELSNLVQLEIEDNYITDEGMKYLSSLDSLAYLNARDNQITDIGLAWICKLSNIEVINLQQTEITDEGLVYFVNLKDKIKILNIAQDNITDAGLQYLNHLGKLELLEMQENYVSDEGMVYLKNINNLKTLNLGGNNIHGQGMNNLLDLNLLEELHIYNNSMDDIGLQTLCSVKSFKNLKTLNAQSNNFTDAALENIDNLESLIKLDLGNNKLTTDCFINLSKLKNLANLSIVDIKVNTDSVFLLNQENFPSLAKVDISRDFPSGILKKLKNSSPKIKFNRASK